VERAAEALVRRGIAARLEHHLTVEGLRHAAREAVAAQADAVLVAGGDGSLGMVAGELAGSPVALGVLPVGTANVFARQMGLPLPAWHRPDALERAALQLMDGRARRADLGRCNGRLFLLWAGVGLDGFVMERLRRQREAARELGLLYNVAATFVIAREWRGADMRLVADGRELAGHFLLVVVSNISLYGGGLFRLRAAVPLDDGQLDVWLFAGRTYAEALAHTARLFAGRHASHRDVTGLTAGRVEIYTPAPLTAQTDGEPLAPAERLSIQVVPQTLQVLVPPEAPRGLFSKE
jgi:diacylglycerol kinase family enzyme